jgi:hypothetical protein
VARSTKGQKPVDAKTAEALWKKSEELVGESF